MNNLIKILFSTVLLFSLINQIDARRNNNHHHQLHREQKMSEDHLWVLFASTTYGMN